MSRLVTRDAKFHAAVKKAGGSHTKYGAGLLVERIDAFWATRQARGVKAERYEMDSGGWGIRSNLVGGLPPVRKAAGTQGKTLAARRAEAMHGV